MSSHLHGQLLSLLTAACILGGVTMAQNAPKVSATDSPSAAKSSEPAPGQFPAAISPASDKTQSAPSAGVSDILKMLEAGISKDVIKLYVETAAVPFHPTAADLILLKNRGVSDEITMAMLKRAGQPEASEKSGPSSAAGSAQPRVIIMPGYTGPDPESYVYFRYYYLHPRTLASVYQRLGFYGAPYDYGPYQPWQFGPGFSPGVSRWPR